MYKSVVVLCVLCLVVIEARPKWQFLPPVPGYIPVYIRTGDTPLEEINPELAEAFHALPAGRSVGKNVEASPEIPELADQPYEDEKKPAPEVEESQPAQEESQPEEPQQSQSQPEPEAEPLAADNEAIPDVKPEEQPESR